MVSICVEVPGDLKERLKIKAYEQKMKISDVIREALWKEVEVSEGGVASFREKKTINNIRQSTVEEQIFLTRCLVEDMALSMHGGGKAFVQESKLRKDQLIQALK